MFANIQSTKKAFFHLLLTNWHAKYFANCLPRSFPRPKSANRVRGANVIWRSRGRPPAHRLGASLLARPSAGIFRWTTLKRFVVRLLREIFAFLRLMGGRRGGQRMELIGKNRTPGKLKKSGNAVRFDCIFLIQGIMLHDFLPIERFPTCRKVSYL